MRKDIIRNLYHLQRTVGDIGVEVEMEGRLNFLNNPQPAALNWDCKDDGSLRGQSCEWVLREPQPLDKALAEVNTLYKHMKKLKSVLNPSRRCGVHVHVNCQELTEQQVYVYIALYMTFENLLARWCGEDREGNLFCLRSEDAEELVFALCHARKRGRLSHIMTDEYRYAGLNVTAIRKFGSLEFRTLGTPRHPKKIRSWIKMLYRMRGASQMFAQPKDIVRQMSAMGIDEFIIQIMGAASPLLEIGTAVERETLLRQGVRHVQDLVLMEMPPRKPMLGNGFFIRNHEPVQERPMPAPIRMEERPWDEELVNEPDDVPQNRAVAQRIRMHVEQAMGEFQPEPEGFIAMDDGPDFDMDDEDF